MGSSPESIRSEQKWDETYDFVIVGSGAASVVASLIVQQSGSSPLIVEKSDMIGGSTALSGGVFWVPNNIIMQREGVADSYEMAKQYLDACAGPPIPGSTEARRRAFLKESPKMVSFLESCGMKWVYAEGWSDYHENELPGGIARGRSLVAQIFDMRRLGSWRHLVRRSTRPPLRLHEASALFLYGRTWKSKVTMVRVGWRLMLNRIGFDLAGTGMAIQGRLFEIAKRKEVPIWRESPVTGLVVENNQVVGIRVSRNGRELRVRARKGVLLNAGGFSRNLQMREKYQPKPTTTAWTMSNPGDTGEILQMAMDIGADTNVMDLAWWNSGSILSDGSMRINVMDLSKPHSIIVGGDGRRYVNESTSYVAVGLAMYERNKVTQAVPSWAILESRHRESFNGFARSGVDLDFRRGNSAYNRFLGDPTVRPNPNLGAIERPPFYAVKIYPADVGTSGGLVTDEFARVLRKDGSVIEGLYATGNITAPVVGRSYPGAGASIASSAAFGYVAAKHAVGATD
jgi:3-oxosteroid 1-dehydrogenase